LNLNIKKTGRLAGHLKRDLKKTTFVRFIDNIPEKSATINSFSMGLAGSGSLANKSHVHQIDRFSVNSVELAHTYVLVVSS
jgi:hypothetical protein